MTAMNALEIATGMTRTEIEGLYISSINALMSLGVAETDAREIVRLSLQDALGIK